MGDERRLIVGQRARRTGGHRFPGGRRLRTAAAMGPFALWTLLFLGLPALAVGVGAFESPGGGFTLGNVRTATHGVYLHGFVTSIGLACVTSVVPGIAGFLVAYAVHTARRGALLHRLVITASGVFANFGGVPLAFLFIATMGTSGMVTGWLKDIGFSPYAHGFTLYGFSGIALVYMYFQVPLMVLVTLPALEGLRPSWREAAHGLGARSWQYWRHVGIPVLLPSVLGAMLLVFGFGFAAYATADALTSGTVPLTPIQIGSFVSGNVMAGQQNVGQALGLGMVLIIAVVMVLYTVLQRRVSTWLH